MQCMYKLEHASHGGGTIYVVVAINQYFFLVFKCPKDAFNCFVHVFHQKGVVQLAQLWAEEFFGGFIGFQSALHEDATNGGMYLQAALQCLHFLRSGRCYFPSFFH